jgi:hypothetical protein
MARQKGLLKIDGTIGGMTFYRTKDGLIVKEQIESTKNKFKNDASYQRTRENAAEFGMAATSGKMVRDGIRSFMANSVDSKVTSRLTQLMSYILKEDKTSARGERTVANGMLTVNGKAFLKHFNFNIDAILGSVLFKKVDVNQTTGEMIIPSLNPINEMNFPQGATHVSFTTAFMSIDFSTGTSYVEYSPAKNVPIDSTVGDIQIEPDEVPTLNPGMNSLYFLCIEFFQEVNGKQYSLKNGSYNALEILEVV